MIDNFERLVERCRARRRRRMIRTSLMGVGSVLLAITAVGGWMQWQQTHDTPPSVPHGNVPALAAAPSPAPVAVPAAPQPAALPQNATPPPVAVAKTPAAPLLAKTAPVLAPAASTPPVAAPEPAKERSETLFDVRSSQKSTPLEAYEASPRYETALAVARDYYAKNDFAGAVTWSKKANQLNREGEEAWLLSARAYHAQGRKSEAIGVLELYLNYKESKAAIEQLRTWKQGE
jgi:hypothetical protein